MDRLQEIDEQLRLLNGERSNLISNESNEKLKSLEWTKECFALLKICSLWSVGLPKYEIVLSGIKGIIPYCSGPICVMGDSKHYQDNIMFSYRYNMSDFSQFYTSNDDMLVKFLEHVTFKKFEYDKELLNMLNRIKTVSEKYESS